MNVLLTNDDGITAPGLKALYNALKKAGHNVFAIAPMSQQSGVGHAVTVFAPLLAKKVTEGQFEGIGVFGTPADCVKLGLGKLCPFRPDLVISGINQGPNAGPDIYYSGTVGAAAEAAHDQVPAMAVSHLSLTGAGELDTVAAHAIQLAEKIRWKELPPGRVVNVNYPDCKLETIAGIRVCPQSAISWPNQYKQAEDPRGEPYWWFASSLDPEQFEAGSDRALLAKNYVTVTPLQFDYTDRPSLECLQKMDLK